MTIKGINNDLYTELPFRMSLNQLNQNPFQKGCQTAVGAAAGCATNNFSATNTNPLCRRRPQQAGANRDDRRTIGGVRWEHEFDADTSCASAVRHRRSQHQPADRHDERRRRFLSYNVVADIATGRSLAGLPTTLSRSARTGTTCRSTATPTLWLRAATRAR